MADIELQGITKQFKNNIVLNDVSFNVKNKEFMVIFGPAGAGKTTLLNIIAGIHVPEKGKVLMNRQVMNTVEPEDRNVAMVFENYALYPHLSVYDNIASPLRSPKYRQPEEIIKQEVFRVAEILRIERLLERKPSELSNGQQQRVSLGRALVRKPEVFLMDEPLTHLDAKLRHQMRAEFKEMQANLNTTTIYVTHDYLEALSLGDRIVIINQGKVEQVGTPDEIYYRPASEFVAEAFGEPEINIFEANIVSQSQNIAINLFRRPDHFIVPYDVHQTLLKHPVKSIRIGFRPVDIHYSLADDKNAMIPAKVYSFEPLGAKAILTAQIHQQWIRLVAPADLDVKLDQDIYLQFDMNKAIFFDAKTKRFLSRSGLKGGKPAWQN
jgi:multiple sugar transport system ATP-binding protein